ncbi:hypothetical protein DPMN_139256 [Dreissena polymorpha]|uniref:Uncharacterized protein n=1 Tax=Dreissena polymorpha TaxID=45954 RepID=A0A9D4JJA8_DREPO|nr:hypothetical protein DPMN_139256 [Dreissena polymorpha]
MVFVAGHLLDCPLCKQSHELPKGRISSLAKDTTRRNLIDFIKGKMHLYISTSHSMPETAFKYHNANLQNISNRY